MTYLLDTHIVLWWMTDDSRLSAAHRSIIEDGRSEVLVSAITVAEIAIKTSLGKLQVPDDFDYALVEWGFGELPFESRHSVELRELPWHHRDPFDRMLISQARADNLTFLTADQRCRQYDVRVG